MFLLRKQKTLWFLEGIAMWGLTDAYQESVRILMPTQQVDRLFYLIVMIAQVKEP